MSLRLILRAHTLAGAGQEDRLASSSDDAIVSAAPRLSLSLRLARVAAQRLVCEISVRLTAALDQTSRWIVYVPEYRNGAQL